jgi:hypothetical protein
MKLGLYQSLNETFLTTKTQGTQRFEIQIATNARIN